MENQRQDKAATASRPSSSLITAEVLQGPLAVSPPATKQSDTGRVVVIQEAKELFVALDTLRSAAWTSFDKRRTYEWKFCIAVWTALAVFTGSLVAQPIESTKTFPVKGFWPVVLTAIFGLAVAALHAFWTKGTGNANNVDRRLSFFYLERMFPLIAVKKEDIDPIVAPVIKRMGTLANYAHFSQVGITVLLVIAAVFAMWARAIPH
jgi:hypothetical protein